MIPTPKPAETPDRATAPATPPNEVPMLGQVEYWRAEARRLRERWGTQDFWQSLERAYRAYDGLVYVWARTNRGVTRADEIAMAGIVNEWTRRMAAAISLYDLPFDLTCLRL